MGPCFWSRPGPAQFHQHLEERLSVLDVDPPGAQSQGRSFLWPGHHVKLTHRSHSRKQPSHNRQTRRTQSRTGQQQLANISSCRDHVLGVHISMSSRARPAGANLTSKVPGRIRARTLKLNMDSTGASLQMHLRPSPCQFAPTCHLKASQVLTIPIKGKKKQGKSTD